MHLRTVLLSKTFPVPNSVKSVGRTILGNTKWLSEQSNTFVIIGDGVLIKINSKDSNISVPDGDEDPYPMFFTISEQLKA